MKKIILFILLTVSTNAFSEWTKLYKDNNLPDWTLVFLDKDYVSAYVSYKSISADLSTDIMRVWVLYNYNKKQKEGHQSNTVYKEYDCNNETVKNMDVYVYAGKMSKGAKLYTNSNIKDEPTSIQPGSWDSFIYKFMCEETKK